jgi:hypothetical protein
MPAPDSEILSLNVCGTKIIILNSLRLVSELFEKKSTIYSSRSVVPVPRTLPTLFSNFVLFNQ